MLYNVLVLQKTFQSSIGVEGGFGGEWGGGGGDSRSLRSFARRLRCGTSILRLLIPLCEKCFFPGSFAAFIYFCSWNDDKDKQSGESESNL